MPTEVKVTPKKKRKKGEEKSIRKKGKIDADEKCLCVAYVKRKERSKLK